MSRGCQVSRRGQAAGTVPGDSRSWHRTCGQALSCRAWDSTAAAAWPASGLGSGPGRSLSCTGSSRGRGPGPPASRRGGAGAGRSTPSPSAAPEIQTRLGVVGRPSPSGRESTQPSTAAAGPHSLPRTRRPTRAPCSSGKRGHGPHPGPAAAPESKQAWKRADGRQSQAVSSLSPARGTSCWRHHVTRHQAARPGPAHPHPAQHLRLPGSTCDPTGAAPADPSRAQTPRPTLSGEWGGGTRTRIRAAPRPRQLRTPAATADVSAGIFPFSKSPLPLPLPKVAAAVRTADWNCRYGAGPLPASLPCLSEGEEAGPPLESFTLSSFASPTCPPGARGQPPSLWRALPLAPLRLQCRQCSLRSPASRKAPSVAGAPGRVPQATCCRWTSTRCPHEEPWATAPRQKARSRRPKPAEQPRRARLRGARPLYRGGGGAGNADSEPPFQTSPAAYDPHRSAASQARC